MPARPRLLWIYQDDIPFSDTPKTIAAEYFQIEEVRGIEAATSRVRSNPPDVAVCELEGASTEDLRALHALKKSCPSVPLLILTTEHTESLAIWALRARMWNYLIKPVAGSELRANFSTLANMTRAPHQMPRKVMSVGALLPQDLAGTRITARPDALMRAVTAIQNDESFRWKQASVAAKCGMTTHGFSRAFKTRFGMTFRDYLARCRIGRACLLLRQGTHDVTTAGQAVGFDDASHFARAFRRLVGVSPSSYRGDALDPISHRSVGIPHDLSNNKLLVPSISRRPRVAASIPEQSAA